MIELKQFVFNPLQVNTWLIHVIGGDGILIDPACMTQEEFSQLSSFIDQQGVDLKYIINTHGHFDHVFGIGMVKSRYNVPFLIDRKDQALLGSAPHQAGVFGFDFPDPLPGPDGYLEDGQLIRCGEIELEVIQVPGHSPGGTAFYLRSLGWLFSGDTLFAGSIGRSDLPGGDSGVIIKSITERLFPLPDTTQVFPGHGPSTTIGREKMRNPYVGQVTRDS